MNADFFHLFHTVGVVAGAGAQIGNIDFADQLQPPNKDKGVSLVIFGSYSLHQCMYKLIHSLGRFFLMNAHFKM